MTTIPGVRTRRHQLLVGGRWSDADERRDGDRHEPGDGRRRGRGRCGRARATSSGRSTLAHEAFERHRWRTPFERAAELERVADVIERRRDAMADDLVIEHGKPRAEAYGEIGSAAAGFRLAAAEARRLTGETIPVEDPRKRVMTFRQPRGVVVAITPWNFPMNIPVEYVGPALASGNAVILKPAPTTAGIAALLAECIVEAGVPDGLFSLLTGPSVEMASALVQHERVVVVGFTGSSAVGAAIARLASGKELVMELGGNGPIVVLDDADPERAIAAIGAAAFFNAGQSCAAAERIIATERAHDWLVDGLVDYARGIRSVTRVTPPRRWVRSTTRAWPPRWTTTWPTPVRAEPRSRSAAGAARISRRGCTTSRPSWRTCPTAPR